MNNVWYIIVLIVVLAGGWVLFQYETANAPTTSDLPVEIDTPADPSAPVFTFACPAGSSFTISYTNDGDFAQLVLADGRTLTLQRARSGSGARYTTDDEAIEFWEHQGAATVRENGVVLYESCPLADAGDTPDKASTSTDTTTAELIVVTQPAADTTVSSPITLSGEARGSWFFEASAPVVVVDWDGKIIGEGTITADGDWMTEDFVPFSGSVTYDLPSDVPYRRGAVIFQKDNPSGLPENDAAVEIPITFQ